MAIATIPPLKLRSGFDPLQTVRQVRYLAILRLRPPLARLDSALSGLAFPGCYASEPLWCSSQKCHKTKECTPNAHDDQVESPGE
jgi:hypothetical protein